MPSSFVDQAKNKSGAYTAPTLKIYGDVIKLTAAGTRGVAENGNQPNCSGQTDRRPC